MEERLDIVVDSSSAKRGIDVLVQSMRDLGNAVKNTESQTDKLFDSMNSGLKKLESAFMSLKSVVLGFGVVIGIFKELGQELAKFQAFISAMSVSVGGVTNARVEYASLMSLADRLGISINSLSHNYTQLSAAAVGTTLSQEKLNKGFESFAIASRVLHLSSADTKLIFYALTQMVSKGVVSMEELRRQLGEKLPGAMNIGARSVGATMQEFETAIRKGTVDSAKFFPIFAAEVERTFGPGMALATKAYDAEVNRLSTSLQKMIVVFYDLGVADSFTKTVKELNRIMSDSEIGKAFATALKNVADDMTRFLQALTPEKVREYVGGFTTAISTLSTTISTALPYVEKLAEYFGKIAAAWLIWKGAGMGAAAGNLVAPGPVGTIGGALVGGAAAAGLANRIGSDFDNQKILDAARKAGSPQTRVGKIGGLPTDYDSMDSWDYMAPQKYTLGDVLRPPKANSTSAMNSFIESLKERDSREGDLGNTYEALRERAHYLAQKEPELLNKALTMIDGLESRGVEFDPLINRIENMINRKDANTPATLDRQITQMAARYPANSEKRQQAQKLADEYRAQVEAEKTMTQNAFIGKQDEIIRKIGDETKLYSEQIDLIGKTNDERDKSIKRVDMEKKLEHETIVLREEAAKSKIKTFDEEAFRSAGKSAIDAAIAELDRLQKATRTVGTGMTSAITAYLDGINNLATASNQLVTSVFKGMEDGIVSFVRTGKLNFKQFADDIVTQLIRIQVQQFIMKPLVGSGGTGGILSTMMSAIFGGMGSGSTTATPTSSTLLSGQLRAANGADWTVNGAGGTDSQMVKFMATPGERVLVQTPEQQSGGGSAPNVMIQVVNQTGQAVDAKQTGTPKFDGEKYIIGVVLSAVQNNPRTRNALAGALAG